MERVKGRPQNTEGRLDKEIRVYDLLDSLGIEYERIDHEPAMTIEACEEIDRVLEVVQLTPDRSRKVGGYSLGMKQRLGIAMALLVSRLTQAPVAISVPFIFLGVLFSMVIGVVFGLLPSIKASNLNPIVALRHE